MIKLRDLQYLDAIARHRHFGNAAADCCVSQPTLSGQIMKLEEQLDLKLIERHRRGVMLTPAGERLVEEARKVLSAADEFENCADELKDPLSGDLHMGLIPTVAPYLLPRIMPRLYQKLPRIQFYLHELKTHELLEQLDTGRLDILILPYLKGMQKYDRYDLFAEELVLATYPGHPLAGKSSCTLASLEGHHVLTLEDGHCLRDQALDYCFAAGADEDGSFRATSLETLRHMVGGGVGITLMPDLAARDDQDQSVCYRRFKKPAPKRDIVLLTRQNYTRVEIVRAIVAEIREAAKAILNKSK